jgi:autotransporter-associated beta strand protein
MRTARKFRRQGLVEFAAIALTMVAACAAMIRAGQAAVSELVVLGDTQYYTLKAPASTLVAQNQWIVDNLATENIAFVTQVGDVTTDGRYPNLWQNADQAMRILDGPGPYGVVPYSVSTGNHDVVLPTGPSYFATYFGSSRYANYSWFGGASSDQLSNYQVFKMNGVDYLHLNLTFLPDQPTLNWAQSVLGAHPGMPTIMTTHDYMNMNVPGRDAEGNYLWSNFVRWNAQIFMVVCGHNWPEQHQVSTNAAGGKVVELMANFQELPNGGDGWLQKVIFDPDAGQIRVKTYSPTLDAYKTGSNDEFAFSVTFGSTVTINGEISPVRMWSGSASNSWSDAGNWSLAPVNGDSLTFSGTSHQNCVNDTSFSNVSQVTFTNGGFNVTGNGLTLNAGITNVGNNNWGISSTLGANQTITSNSGTLTISGPIDNNGYMLTLGGAGNIAITNTIGGTGGLTKTGAGTATLAAGASYFGPTTVSAGKLSVCAYVAGPVTVAGGATLDASGTIDNAVTVAPGGALEVAGAVGTQLYVNSLKFLGSAELSLIPNATLPDVAALEVYALNGLSALGGTGSVTIDLSGELPVGTYSLIDYTGTFQGGLSAFRLGTLPSGMAASLANNAGRGTIDLVVAHGVAVAAQWTGGGADGIWTTAANWDVPLVEGGAPTFEGSAGQTTYNDLSIGGVDKVTFKNGGFDIGGNPLILYGGMECTGDNAWNIDSRLFFNEAFRVNSGTLTVNGVISGTTALTKTGSGTLRLTRANSYSGGTAIDGGTVVASTPSALGSGRVTISSGGRLAFDFPSGSNVAFANSVSLPAVGTSEFAINDPSYPTVVRMTGKITGGAAGQNYTLVDSGVNENHKNTLILDNSANDFRGNVCVSRGALGITSNGALGDPNNGVTLNVGNGNGGLRFCADNIKISITRCLQLVGSEAIDVQGYSATIDCPIVGLGGFTKMGYGTLTLNGPGLYGGPTVVSAGRLVVNGPLTSSSITVNGGATLAGRGTIGHALVLNESAILEAGGGFNTATTLAVSTLSFAGSATIDLSPNFASPMTGPVVVGALNGLYGGSSDSITVNVDEIVSAGTYRLLDYQGAIQGAGFGVFRLGSLPVGMDATLLDNTADSAIDLIVTQSTCVKSTWTGGGGDNQWRTAGNWDAPPSSGGIIVIPPNVSGVLVNNGAVSQVRMLTLGGNGSTIAGDAIALGGVVVSTGNNTWAVSSTLLCDQTIQVDSGTLTVTAAITGGHSLTKTGPGTLVLADAEFTGDLLVAEGTLQTPMLTDSPQIVVTGTLIAGSISAERLTIGDTEYSPTGTYFGNAMWRDPSAVPEPTSLGLLASSMVSLGGLCRWRGRRRRRCLLSVSNSA